MKFYEKILLDLESEEHTMRTVYGHAFAFSDETAFEYSAGSVIHKISYSGCRREILRICGILKEHITQDTIVALIMKNSPLWVECFWAVLMAGGRVMPLSEDMTYTMLAGCMRNSGCRLILGDRKAPDCTNIPVSVLEKEAPSKPVENEPESGWGDEIILSTSATTGEPVLYSYTGSQICAQILNSGYVLKHCKDISRFWKGQFRMLAFLPFCH
ncbi:MAG: long-chain fatty acid--CoA ligase, partial [Lachnospiraceae bacterium]|nr:long-chain fatty acid--CoA ligase [Lachnospiraceae bacterium]